MINFIKMDIYRYFRSASFWVCLGIFTFLVWANAFPMKKVKNMSFEEYVEYTYGMTLEEYEETFDGDTMEFGFTYNGDEMIKEGFSIDNSMQSYFTGFIIHLFCFIIISIMLCKEYNTGYIKNTINIPNHKWYNNISKLIISLMTFIIFTLDIVVVYKIVMPSLEVKDYGEMFKFLGIQLLLAMALSALIILICNLARNTAVCIIFSSISTMGFISLIVRGISKLTHIKESVLSKVFLTCKIPDVTLDVSDKVFNQALILGIITLIVYGVSGAVAISKRDV